MKRVSARHQRHFQVRRKLVYLLVVSMLSGQASANPTGPEVVNGSASFATGSSVLTVTNSPGTIINWQSFSIDTQETTIFVQQSADSAVLNRVVGVDPSLILGTLESNGQVFLINPSGVLFGEGARIDVAGLVASTLNLSNEDFLAGKLNFTSTAAAGSIRNDGVISTPSGGSVILVASRVENNGLIFAPDGNVILAAGASVRLGDTGAPNVLVEIDAPDNQAVNLGEIVVAGGTAGIYGGFIDQKGIVSANSVGVDASGRIVFKATHDTTLAEGSVTSANGRAGGSVTIESGGTTLVQGEISATGSTGTGGGINLLGTQVGVTGNALVDASGATGGGTILVGGDYMGSNADILNARETYLGVDATLRADATDKGDGGRIILWSEEATRAYGQISAQGSSGGNGGFVETSSRGELDITQAPNVGSGGTWLIDPLNLLVDAATALLINSTLDRDGNVVLDTTDPLGTDLGNITVDAAITKSTGTTSTLTLLADNDITVTNAGSISGINGTSLVVAMDSDQDNSGAGSITVFGSIDTGSSGGFTADNIIFFNNTNHFGGLFTVSGKLELGANAVLVFDYNKAANSSGSLVLDPNLGGGVTLRSATGAGFSTGTMTVSDADASGAGVVILDGVGVSASSLALDTHFITLQNSAGLSTFDLAMTSGTIQGAGNLTVLSSYDATGGAINLDLASSSASITQSSFDLVLNIPIQAQSVTLQAFEGSIVDGNGAANNVTAGTLSMFSSLGDVGTYFFDVKSGTFVDDPIETAVSQIDAQTAAVLNVANSGNVTVNDFGGGAGVVRLSSTGDIVLAGVLSSGDTVDIKAGTAGNGDLDIQNGTISASGQIDLTATGGSIIVGGLTGLSTSAGAVNLNAPTLFLASDFTLAAGTTFNSLFSGLTIAGAAPTTALTNQGTLSLDDTTVSTVLVNQGTIDVGSGATVSGGSLLMSGGVLSGSGDVTFASLTLSGGSLSGTGNLTVTTDFTQTGGTVGSGYQNLALTHIGDFTVGSYSAANQLSLTASGGSLFIDGVTLAATDITLTGDNVELQPTTSAGSFVNATSSVSVVTSSTGTLELDGTTAQAKMSAGGSVSITAGNVSIFGGNFGASIDPATISMSVTGDVDLLGGSGGAAEIAGASVDITAGNLSLTGGTGTNGYAAIVASTGDANVNVTGSLSFLPVAADAVIRAPNGRVTVSGSCTGCTSLTTDPFLNPGPDGGLFDLFTASTGGGGTLVEVDNSIVYAATMAETGGEGNAGLSEEEEGGEGEAQQSQQESGNVKKKLPFCAL